MSRETVSVRLDRRLRVKIESAARLAGTTRSDILREGAEEKARKIFREAAEGDAREPSDR